MCHDRTYMVCHMSSEIHIQLFILEIMYIFYFQELACLQLGLIILILLRLTLLLVLIQNLLDLADFVIMEVYLGQLKELLDLQGFKG